MNILKIKEYFKSFKKVTKTCVDNFKEKNIEDYNELIEFLKENQKWETIGNLITGIVNGIELKKCKVCGESLTYYQTKKGYECCSKECKYKNENMHEKMRQTCLERYGVDNPAKSSIVKEKTKKICLKKYGCEHNFQREDVKLKMQDTFMKKYGVRFIGQDKTTREKIHKTNKNRYGFENAIQSDIVKEKIKSTNNEKYGVDYPLQNKKILNETFENGKKTNLLKTGFENANTYKGWNTILSWKDYVIPNFNREEYKGGKNPDIEYEWKCAKCGNVFKQRIYFSAPKTLEHIHRKIPRCLKCYPLTNGFSYCELELLDFVKKFFPTAHKDKKLIYPLELDILIKDINLAIEFNGNYYHSIDKNFGVPLGYHLKKTLMCNEKGYRLIHIWEDEWIDSQEKVKERLKAVLERRESFEFVDDEIALDRSWYNNVEIPEYELIEETPPTIVQRHMYDTEDCGYLIYKKKQ